MAIGAVVVLVLSIVAAWYFLSDKRAIASLAARGRLVTPVGESAYDRYLARGGWSPADKADIDARVGSPLRTRGDEIIERLKQSNLESEADWAEAVRAFEWLRTLRPDAAIEARYCFCDARLKFIKGESSAAIESYRRAAQADPSWALPYNGLARIFARAQDRTQAQQYYLLATRADPGWIYPWLNLGVVSYELKDYAAAEQALNRALAIDPTKASAHYFLGRTLDDTRRRCAAAASYRAAVENAYRSDSPGFSVDSARTRAARLASQYGCQ